MDNCDKFLALYNDMDDLLRKKYHEPDRTKSVIVRAVNDLNRTGKSDYILMAKKLNMIRVLRNNLIHELDMNSQNLIDITPETIDSMERFVLFLRNPNTAKDLCTPIKDIYSIKFDDETPIELVIKQMREKGYSQVPILNHQNLVRGVLTPNVIFDYVSKNGEAVIDELKISDLKEFYALDKHFSESYAFVKESMIEEDIDDLFAEAYMNNKKLVMAFVTKTGSSSEPITGIIVLKDLLNNSLFVNK